jgi:hypothetical protein
MPIQKFDIRSSKLPDLTLRLYYSEQGQLLGFRLSRPTDEATFNQLAVAVQYNLADLLHLYRNSRHLITRVVENLTFDHFWLRYNYKVHKHQAQKIWEKLRDDDRQAAYDKIPLYDRELRQTHAAKLFPKTYLNQRKWEDYL